MMNRKTIAAIACILLGFLLIQWILSGLVILSP